jgi:hypothetical protein
VVKRFSTGDKLKHVMFAWFEDLKVDFYLEGNLSMNMYGYSQSYISSVHTHMSNLTE